MTNPLQQRVEQAMAELDAHQTRLNDLQQHMADAATTIAPKNRRISVTVDGQGELVEVKFPSNVHRTMPAAELGRLIVDTVNEAREEARRKMTGLFESVMPGGLPFGDMLNGPVDLSHAQDEITRMAAEAEQRLRSWGKQDSSS